MPWKARSEWLKEAYDININDRTLRNWCSKLIKSGTIFKDTSEKTYWITYKVDGETKREEVEKDDPRRIAYWKDYWDMVQDKKLMKVIHRVLWNKY